MKRISLTLAAAAVTALALAAGALASGGGGTTKANSACGKLTSYGASGVTMLGAAGQTLPGAQASLAVENCSSHDELLNVSFTFTNVATGAVDFFLSVRGRRLGRAGSDARDRQ